MKLLLVVDVQYDFIYGALGSDYAQKILPDIQKYISDWREDNEDSILSRMHAEEQGEGS